MKKISKSVLVALFGIIGILGLGLGTCLLIIWNSAVLGLAMGMLGILALLYIIPVRHSGKQ